MEPERIGNLENMENVDAGRRDFVRALAWAGLYVFGGTSGYLMRRDINKLNEIYEKSDLLDEKINDLNDEINEKIGRREEAEKIEREIQEKREKEILKPYEFGLGEGSDSLALARVLYAEGRDHYKLDNYLDYIASTVLNRAKKGERKVKDVIFEGKVRKGNPIYQYSAFNRNNPNRKIVLNPVEDKSRVNIESWVKSYEVAEKTLREGAVDDKVTHYWVAPIVREPSWARGEKPVKTFDYKGKTTRFYQNIPYAVLEAHVPIDKIKSA